MDKLHTQIWNNCLSIIKDNIPAISFRTWFEPIRPLKLEKKILTIQVPSHFFYEYLEEKYIDLLRTTIRKELGADAKLEYSIVMDNNSQSKPLTVEVPEKNKTPKNGKEVTIPVDPESNQIRNPFVIPGIKKIHVDPQLNPGYTFDYFIEGDCNRLARSAGYAVANSPGKTPFNPLIIYGESGLGKTHLAQAIGTEVKEKYPEKVVLYVTANKFQTQFTEAVRNNNKNDFLHFYQMIDVLIIDDIQEFVGKEKTQMIFFHIFNQLHQSGKQLILTSDISPANLDGMEKRLISRFRWGLSADLQNPDYKTRLAILQKKLYKDGINMPNEVLDYIAQNITANVRELEGALISLLAQSTLNRKTITPELAVQLIDKLVKRQKPKITVDHIQTTVCDYFNMPVESMHSKSRKREIVQARQIAMYFSKTMTKSSLSTIGATIGGKDHATVLHACKTVKNLKETDKKFKIYIEEISRRLTA